MLKSLLSKIKSEKSSQVNSIHSTHKQQPAQPSVPIEKLETAYGQLGEEYKIDSEIRMIRYRVFEAFPNIYNSVLACPISVFNLLPYAKRKVKEIDLRKNPLPAYIAPLQALLAQELPGFNHLLINVYPPGVGIMPHFDGPLYRSKVVVLSLGGPSIISFAENYANTHKVARLLLQDQSIHIFESEAYENYLHGIQNYTIDSIFIKVESTQGQPKVVRSSVANFNLTRLHNAVLDRLKQGEEESEMELGKQVMCKCCLMRISENEEYNYKIEIARQERISITIRQKLA